MNKKVQYSAIVRAEVRGINAIEDRRSEIYLLCRQNLYNPNIEIENKGLDIILDKNILNEPIFLTYCEILSFEHICNVYSLNELKEFCEKYNLIDVNESIKDNKFNCRGLIINEYLEPLGWEEELEENNEER